MYYNVHCTFIGMYISDFLKILSKMFCCSVKYSELCLAGISQKSQPPPPPPIPPKKFKGARPYGLKNLYPSKKPATVTQQLQKSIDFRRIELYDFHLWINFDAYIHTLSLNCWGKTWVGSFVSHWLAYVTYRNRGNL